MNRQSNHPSENNQNQKFKLDILVQDLVLDTKRVNQSPVILQRKRSGHDDKNSRLSSSTDTKTIDILMQDLAFDTTKEIQSPVILQRKGHHNNQAQPSKIRNKIENVPSVRIPQQKSVSNSSIQADLEAFKTQFGSLKKSSVPNEALSALENIRNRVSLLSEDIPLYSSTFNMEAVRILTLVMKKFSDNDIVRYEAKSTLMTLIPKLRLHDTSSSGMLGVSFACLLQRENDTLVVDALELLYKYTQTGNKTHIDAILSSKVLCKVAQWQFEKLNSDRGRKYWCAKIQKLMSEIIWEISTRGSDRQVSTLIDENPILAKAFVSFLMDMQGETPSTDVRAS